MLRARYSLLGFVVVLAAVNCVLARQTDRESLKSALEAVTRKQRSLDLVPQDYYNKLRSFKLHPSDVSDDEFERNRQQNLEDDDDEDLEFLPLENGQLENIGGGYQNFNNKRLERALIDYFENPSPKRENTASAFRERERSGGHKRATMNDRLVADDGDKELAALFYKELQNGPNYNTMGEVDRPDYSLSDTLQSYYDRYRAEQNKLDKNKFYESSSGPMAWGDMFGKQESGRNHVGMKNDDDEDDEDDLEDRDRESVYLLPAERRNVNGRYPLGRDYSLLLKRYPMLSKRSPKPLPTERQNDGVITDPKVAKDLGALFGNQPDEVKNNRTHDHRDKVQHAAHGQNDRDQHNHAHDHDHGKDHSGHDHDHHHDHSHDDDARVTSSGSRASEATSSDAPMISNPPETTDKPGQKEISNGGTNKVGKMLNKRNQRAVDVKKKNVDWSQYFGIDRRKKKAALLARPNSQDQDDEWMLQRYYKTMAENLKSPETNSELNRDNGDKRDKLDQMDEKLKNVKNLIVEDALKYGSDENSDAQEVKDVVVARLAAAYSLEKMRRALDEFRSNIAAQRQLMKAAHANNNTINNFRDDSDVNENVKRNVNSIVGGDVNSLDGRNFEGVDEGRGCPELENIERSCRPAKSLIPGLYEPCVTHQICRACDDDDDECSNIFSTEVSKICETSDNLDGLGHCARTALVIWQMRPSPMASAVCHANADSCLRRQYRYRHRGLYYQQGWLPRLAVDGPQLRER